MKERGITYEGFVHFPTENFPAYNQPEFEGEINLGVLLARGKDGKRDTSSTAIITETGESITYAQFDEKTDRIANALHQLGVEGGDRVVFFTDLFRSKELVYFATSAFKITAVAYCPIAELLIYSQVEQLVEKIQPKYLVVGEIQENSVFSLFLQDYSSQNPQKVFSMLENNAKNSFPNLFDLNIEKKQEFSLYIENSKGLTPAFFFNTSGTTGLPKLCLHHHSSLYYTIKAFLGVYHICVSDTLLNLAGGGGSYGFISTILPLFVGARALIVSKADAKAVISAQKPNVVFSGPTFYHSLLHIDYQLPATCRYLFSAGESLQETTYLEYKKRYNITLLDINGSSELSYVYVGNTPEFNKCRSSGKIVPGYQVKLLDENNQEIREPGKKGIMYVKGPSSCFYYKSPEAQAKVVNDGWYCTCDSFSFDAEGYYYCYGRQDDIIIVRSANASPTVIENEILKREDVLDAGVVGSYSEEQGTSLIYAGVVYKGSLEDKKEKEKEILDWINELGRVPAYCRVTAIVLLDQLPRLGTGSKLNRKLLREKIFSTLNN